MFRMNTLVNHLLLLMALVYLFIYLFIYLFGAQYLWIVFVLFHVFVVFYRFIASGHVFLTLFVYLSTCRSYKVLIVKWNPNKNTYLPKLTASVVKGLACWSSCAVDRGLEPRSVQTKDCKIGIGVTAKSCCLGIKIMWPSGAIPVCLSVDCCFSKLAL